MTLPLSDRLAQATEAGLSASDVTDVPEDVVTVLVAAGDLLARYPAVAVEWLLALEGEYGWQAVRYWWAQ